MGGNCLVTCFEIFRSSKQRLTKKVLKRSCAGLQFRGLQLQVALRVSFGHQLIFRQGLNDPSCPHTKLDLDRIGSTLESVGSSLVSFPVISAVSCLLRLQVTYPREHVMDVWDSESTSFSSLITRTGRQ